MISQPPKKRLSKRLLEILAISAVAHLAILILFGGYTVYRYVIPSAADFEEPPPMIEETPPPTSVEVSIQRPPPASLPGRDLAVQAVGSIAINAVPASALGFQESFFVADTSTTSGMSSLRLGGSSSIGLGVSEISVFGIRDSGERILFAVDTGRNMLLDSKGGLYSYNAIKEELIRLINGLSPGTLFNVILFEGTRRPSVLFRPSMVPAIPQNFDAFNRWFMPINQRADQVGLTGTGIPVSRALVSHPVGQTFAANDERWPPQPWLIQNALEQDADLIYVITANWGGFSNLLRTITERELQQIERDKARLEATSAFQREHAAHMEEKTRLREVIRQREAAEAAERRQRNLPPRVWIHNSVDSRHGFHERRRAYDIPMRNRDPRPAELFWPRESPIYRHEPRQVEDYFRNYLRAFYRDQNKPIPRMNVILFLAEDEELSRERVTEIRSFLRHFNNGQMRELRGLAAIQASRRQ